MLNFPFPMYKPDLYQNIMKQLMLCILVALLVCCKTAKPATSIDFTPIINFIVRQDVHLTEEVSYFFYNNEIDFRNTFTLTKSSPGLSSVPDFALQHVIAIALKQTKEIVDIKFTKVDVTSNDLNVYYTKGASMGTSFLHTPFTIATIPKSEKIKHVNFFNDGTKEKVIEIGSN
jgi:hypothetical protein